MWEKYQPNQVKTKKELYQKCKMNRIKSLCSQCGYNVMPWDQQRTRKLRQNFLPQEQELLKDYCEICVLQRLDPTKTSQQMRLLRTMNFVESL